VSALELVLAGTIILAVAIQIFILVSVNRTLTRFSATAERLTQSMEPQIRDVASSMQKIRTALDTWGPEIKATLSSIRATTETLGDLAQQEGRELAKVVEQSTAIAHRQLAQTDQALDQTRQRVTEILEGFDRTVLEPARVLLALAAGVRRGVEKFTHSESNRKVS